MPVDFTGMDDSQVEAVRLAALAEINARGERFQVTQQMENGVSTLKNRGYVKEEVVQLFNEAVEKVYADVPPPAEPAVRVLT
jgi:hypothetical protein